MESTREQKGELEILSLAGDLTVEHAGELKHTLIQTIGVSNRIEIKLGEVADVDLSALQLFCSAHRTAMNLRKELYLNNSVPECFKDIVKKAGLARHMGCTLNPNELCLWVESKA